MKSPKFCLLVFSWIISSQSLLAGPPGQVVAWGGISLPYESGSVFTNIGAGWDHAMAIRNDGKLFVWGKNWEGEAQVPAGLSNVIAAAGGEQHTFALTADGHVFSFGQNAYGQANIPQGLSNVVAIAADEDDNVALKSDGTVMEWGNNGTNVPAGLSNVTAISAASDYWLALKN